MQFAPNRHFSTVQLNKRGLQFVDVVRVLQGLGRPCRIEWCEASSCLLIAHRKGVNYRIDVVRVELPPT